MKKLTLISAMLFLLFSVHLQAQDTDQEVIPFTAILQSVLNLNVTGGETQEAVFDTPDKYNFGIDAVGTTTITVESTASWNLQIRADDFAGPETYIIPINNVGVWCEATGTYTIGGEVACDYTSLGTALGLSNADQMLLDIGTTGENSGDASDNAFNLNWTMGTMNGTMNALSIFQQLSNGTIGGIGTYTTDIVLTLTALP